MLYKSKLHTSFQIDKIETIILVSNPTKCKCLKRFTSTPLERTFVLVLQSMVPSCKFLFPSFPLLYISYVFHSWSENNSIPITFPIIARLTSLPPF